MLRGTRKAFKRVTFFGKQNTRYVPFFAQHAEGGDVAVGYIFETS